jgi:hypothetical protein
VTRPGRRHVAWLTIGAAIFAALFAALLVVRQHDAMQYSGDEPHYVIVASSLVYDGSFDIKNAYARAGYRGLPVPPDAHINPDIFTPQSSHWYSSHGAGLPALIAPGLAVANAWGAAVEMVGFAAVLLGLVYAWTRRFANRGLAILSTAVFAISPFFLGLEGRIFPDLVTAVILVACLLILEAEHPRWWQLITLSLLAGFAPWVHLKNIPAAVTIVVVAAVSTYRRARPGRRVGALILVIAPALLSAIVYELSIRDWYGGWSPTRMTQPGRDVLELNPIRGLEAALFDSSHGLFASNPAYALVLVGLPIWAWRARASFIRLALIVGPSILVQATFSDWSAGYAPPGRYALQFMPALVPAFAFALREGGIAFRVVAGVLIATQWALDAAFVWLRPQWNLAGSASPLFTVLRGHVHYDLDRMMPTFDLRGRLQSGGWPLAVWWVVLGALLAYGVWTATAAVRDPSKRPT